MKIRYIIFAALLILCANSYAQVAVIVNKSVPASSINKAKLLDIYSLTTKSWDNGSKIVLTDQKNDNTVKSKFYGYIGKSNADLKKVWMRMQLTGAGFAPEALSSDEEIVRKVASTPGAIGYVSQGAVTDDVKVVAKIE